MGVLHCCSNFLLIVINVIVLLIGGALLAAGLVLKYARSLVNDYFSLDELLANIRDMAEGTGEDVTPATDVSVNEMLDSVTLTFIILGSILLALAICGCVGTCCKARIFLVVYALAVFIILAAILVLVILFYSHTFDSVIKTYLKNTLVNNYDDLTDFTLKSLPWNIIMLGLHCCGVDDYHDFNATVNWDPIVIVVGDKQGNITQVTPVVCCKMANDFPDVTLVDRNCSFTPTTNNSNYLTGCYDAVWDKLDNYNSYIIAVVVVILVLLALCFLSALYVYRHLHDE